MPLKPQRFPRGCMSEAPTDYSERFCNYSIGALALTVAVVFAGFAVMFFFYPAEFGCIIEQIKQLKTR